MIEMRQYISKSSNIFTNEKKLKVPEFVSLTTPALRFLQMILDFNISKSQRFEQFLGSIFEKKNSNN